MKKEKFGIFGWLLIKVLTYNKLAFWEWINEAFSTYFFARFRKINICKVYSNKKWIIFKQDDNTYLKLKIHLAFRK